MSAQLVLTLIAATVGFVAAVFFCIGNAFNSAEKISLQGTAFYDINQHLASSLAAQKAQYVVGALLLLASFVLQIWATQASATSPVSLPQYLDTWIAIVGATVLPVGGLSGLVSWWLYERTIEKVLAIAKARREESERKQRR